jgi:cobalt-zinc-cadmium resistance protein CzcA
MLNAIIQFSIRNKLIIGLFVVFLIGYGSYQFTKLPIDAVPDITNNQVLVITQSPSLGAPDIERLITFPIEQALSNIPGKIEIRSFSRFGLSLVTIVFNDETDVYWARNQVTERLTSVQSLIPENIGVPELGPATTGLGEIYQYVLRPKKGYEEKYDAQELRTLQDWIVRRQLLGIEGVADVSSFGGYLKQIEIAVDPAQLAAHGISLDEVYVAIQRNNQNEGGAYIEKGSNVLYIRTEGLITELDQLKQIAIKLSSSGTPLLLKDIAEVRIGHATRYGALVYNDEAEVAGAVIMMLKGANSNLVIKNVKEKIELIRQTLPEGVELEAFLDRTKMVNNAISTVETNLAEGALIVVFILVLFLGNLRAGFLVASVIPLSMLFAVIMMNLFGVSGNLMSLGALDFGLIVDGAVIIVEAVMHLLTQSKKLQGHSRFSKDRMDHEVGNAAGRMMNAAVFGQLIILIVYLPIFSLQGIEGKMFKPMAQTVAFALAGAFLLSLTYVPMMSALLLRNISHEPNFADRWMHKLETWYERQLQKAMKISEQLVIVLLLFFGLSIYLLTTLGGEFIPSLEEGDFAVETRVLTGSNLKVSVASAKSAAKVILEEFPEVEKVVTKIGSGEIPTDPMPIEAMDMMIILKDKKEWTSASNFNELAEKMSEALKAVPGVTFGFQYPVQMRFNELMTGARQDVVCKIFGENLDTLAHLGKHLGELSHNIEGAKDVYVESILGMPQIVVKYKRDVLAQYGLQIDEVNTIVNAAFAGKKAGLFFEAERRFDLVVRLSEENRRTEADIKDLLIPTQGHQFIPLRQLAEVEIINGPNQIQREDAKRRMIVGFNVRGRDVQSIVQDLQAQVKQKLKLPPGYYITYGGSFENLEAAKSRLAVAVPISLLLILVLLYFAFKSIRQGLLIYSAIPLSAMGGIFALALRGLPFSISAGIGFIALFGVAVLNGIVLVTEFNRQLQLPESTLKDAVINGSKLRLRPVLMTAAVASLGFLPMALSNGAGAEVQRPLATVVIGGLLIATLLTLFILPILYVWFERKKHSSMLTKLLVIGVLSFGSNQNLQAQQRLTLEEAKQLLQQRNPKLEASKLQTLYAQKLSKQAYTIPQTTVSFERGQFNSAFIDNRFDVSQSFDFPAIYSRQKQLLKQEWAITQTQQILTEKELLAELSIAFTELLKIQLLENLYREADTQMIQLIDLAKLRNKAGETDVTESAYLSQQRAETLLQLNQLLSAKFDYQLRLQLLLDSDTIFVPVGDFQLPKPFDSSASTLGITAKLLTEQSKLAQANYRLEKAKLLPDVLLGYGNLSITGIGNDDIYYGADKRFQTFQVGVGVPLFFGSNQNRIAAAKIGLAISEKNLSYGLKQLNHQQMQLLEQLQRQDTLLQYFKTNTLVQSINLREAADKQYASGQINYLSYIMLWNQYMQTQTRYLALVQTYNEIIIQLQKIN